MIIIRAATSSFGKVGMPKEATTGIVFTLRLVFLSIAIVTVIGLIGPVLEGEVILTIGALTGTALGLAFSRALSNLVSGVYILAARPFRVGDFIRIGDDEGIVHEITLNYTSLLLQDYSRILIPNIRVLDGNVANYRVRLDDYLSSRASTIPGSTLRDIEGNSRFSSIKELVTGDEIYRYTFTVVVNNSYSRDDITEYFDEICKKWTPKFLEPPEYIFWSTNNWGHYSYRFAISVINPLEIFTCGTDFHAEVTDFKKASK